MLAAQGYLDRPEPRRASPGASSTREGHAVPALQLREDLVMAIAVQGMELRAGLFERAAPSGGSSRERIRPSRSPQFSHEYPDYFEGRDPPKIASFAGRASEGAPERARPGRRTLLPRRQCRRACGAGRRRSAGRRLPPPGASCSRSPRSASAARSWDRLPALRLLAGIDELAWTARQPVRAARRPGWRPLSRDFDMAVAVDRRLRAEVFPEATWPQV